MFRSPYRSPFSRSSAVAVAEVATNAATNIEAFSTTLQGELTYLTIGETVDVYFRYREKGAPGWTSTSPQEITATGSFHEDIEGLDQLTTYEFKAVVDWGEDEDVGDTLEVRTTGVLAVSAAVDALSVSRGRNISTSIQAEIEAVAPLVIATEELSITTKPATAVFSRSATLNGRLDLVETWTPGADVEVFFEYRKVGAGSWTETYPRDEMDESGNFSFQLIAVLTPSTDYEFRAVAEHGITLDTGETKYFTTTATLGLNFWVGVDSAVTLRPREVSKDLLVAADIAVFPKKHVTVDFFTECETETVLTIVARLMYKTILALVETEAFITRQAQKKVLAVSDTAATITRALTRGVLVTVRVLPFIASRPLAWLSPFLIGVVRKIDEMRGRVCKTDEVRGAVRKEDELKGRVRR